MQFNQFYLLRFYSLFIFLLSVSIAGSAQVIIDSSNIPAVDSLIVKSRIVVKKDSLIVLNGDSVSKRPVFADSLWKFVNNIPLNWQILNRHPYFNFNARAISISSDKKEFQGKELLFYVITALVIIFALLKLAFAKYFNDLLRVFFRTTLKQRQIKEQLIQTPLPSLMFNGFFVTSAGLYINFLFQYFKFTPVANFWLLFLYCCIGLSIIYLVKFVGLIIFGWLFNMQKAAGSYIFIVFIINKIIGISLLPFLVLLGLTDGVMHTVSLVMSWCCVCGLLLYRFILGFAAIRNEVRFNLFHFFLYLCAFEIAPLLLIYKVLLFLF